MSDLPKSSPKSSPKKSTKKSTKNSPKVLPKILLFVVAAEGGRKAAYFAGKSAGISGAIVSLFYLEKNVTFGQWQLLGGAGHDEFHSNAEKAMKSLAEIIIAQGGKYPILHYVEPQPTVSETEHLRGLVDEVGAPIHRIIIGCDFDSQKSGRKLTEGLRQLIWQVMELPDLEQFTTLIPESLTFVTLDTYFNDHVHPS